MIRRGISVLLLCCVLLCTAGCNKINLKNRAVVQGIAVDKFGDGYAVTVQVYRSAGAESQEVKYDLHTARGETIYAALSNLPAVTGKQPFYADTQVILFSRDVLNDGLYSCLDYFVRSNNVRDDTPVACSSGSASELLTGTDTEGGEMQSARISELLTDNYGYGKTAGGLLYLTAGALISDAQDAYLPVFTLCREPGETAPKRTGTLCFSMGYPVCELNEREERAFFWIAGFFDNGTYTAELKGRSCCINFLSASRTISAETDGEYPHFTVELSAEASLEESAGYNFQAFSDEEISILQDSMQQQAEESMRTVVQKTFTEAKSDIFTFGEHLRMQKYDAFRQYGNWHDAISDCTFTFIARIDITHAGREKARP